jgi:hypothetical protein
VVARTAAAKAWAGELTATEPVALNVLADEVEGLERLRLP